MNHRRRSVPRLVGFEYDPLADLAHFSMYVPGHGGRERKRATVEAWSYDEAVQLWSEFRARVKAGAGRVSPEAPTFREFVAAYLPLIGANVAATTLAQLQRRLPSSAAIPDVLAIRDESAGRSAFVFACEVDLGGERLAGTFLPKLKTLHSLLLDWRGGADAQILVLTQGIRRAQAINDLAQADELAIVAACLPPGTGPGGLASVRDILEKVLTHAFNAS